MDLFDAIRERRAVRDFSDKRVLKSTLMTLLHETVQSPSAVNVQPWAFCIIQDKEMLKRYSDRAKTLMIESSEVRSISEDLHRMLADPVFNIFYNAETLILICAKPQGKHPDWDCCFAAQTLMLAAHGMGLATCPIGFAWALMDQSDVRKELNIPSGYTPVLPIIVGYPAGKTAPTMRREADVLCWRGPL